MTYLRKLFSTGAIRKSPPSVIGALLAEIVPVHGQVVVEFGSGQGEITIPLAHQLKAYEGSLFAFEFDVEIGAALHQKIPEANVLLEDAFHFSSFIPANKPVDYFVCALPLSFFPRPKVASLLQQMKACLNSNGKIIIIFSAPWLIRFFRYHLPKGNLRTFPTFPLYFMYTYHRPDL